MKNSLSSIFKTGVCLLAMTLGLTTGCSKEAKQARNIARGDEAFAANELQKAEIHYLNVLKSGGMDPAALRQLGVIYAKQGRLLQAFPYLEKAAALEPDNLELRMHLAIAYLTHRKSKEASEQARYVLSKNPTNDEAILLVAETASTKEEVAKAQQIIDELRRNQKDRASFHLALSSFALRNKNLAEAEAQVKQAVAMDPDSPAANIAWGNLLWFKEDIKGADTFLKKGSELADARSPRRLAYADFKVKTGDLDTAKKVLEEVAAKTPDNVRPWSYLAEIAFKQKRFDDCADLVKKILLLDPNNYDAQLKSGNLEMVKGNAQQALLAFERMTPVYGTVPQVQYHIALAHLANDDLAKAAANLAQALTLDPENVDAILLSAELNIRRGNADAAVTPLSQLVKEKPGLPKPHLLLAAAYLSQNDPEAAVGVYKKMQTVFPKNREVPFLLGNLYVQQSKLKDARPAFAKSLELSPDFYPAIEQLIMIDIAEKNHTSAQERIEAEMKKNPKSGSPWVLLGNLEIAKQNLKGAETALLKAIELDPSLETAYMQLVGVYDASGRSQDALAKLTEFSAKNTNHAGALMQIGMLNEAMTNLPAARAAYEKLLTVSSNYAPALNNLAYLYSEHLKDPDKALEIAERARKAWPTDANTADTLAWILYKKGDYSRAHSLMLEAASAPALASNPEVLLHLGLAQYMVGDEQGSRASLEKALTAPKPFPGKDEAQKRLAILAIDGKNATPERVKELEKMQRDQPDDPVVLSRLAAVYERDGRKDKAIESYEGVLKRNPQNVPAMVKLARYYLADSKKLNEAINLLNEAHRLAPDDALITAELARAVDRSGNYKRALVLYEESARKLGNNPEILFDLAKVNYNLGRIDEAKERATAALKVPSFSRASAGKDLVAMIGYHEDPKKAAASAAQIQQAYQTDPNDTATAMAMASLTAERSDAKGAAQIYEKIYERNPLFLPAGAKAVELYAVGAWDDKKGYALAVKVREANPTDAEIAKATGILAYRTGDYARAVQLLKESARKAKDDAEVLYHLGLGQYKMKDAKESKSNLQRALALNAQSKLAPEAKRVVAEIK